MRVPVLIMAVFFTILVVARGIVNTENQTRYTVQIGTDRSAAWTISQTVGINSSVDTLDEFQRRVTSLVEAAESKTGRDMAAGVDSMKITPSGSYIAVEYKLTWTNFSEVENTRMTFGDVFQVQGFFLELYGDGEVYVTYPSEYVVESVSPSPSYRNDSLQLLQWLGTNDLNGPNTRIVLREESAASGFVDILEQNTVLIVSFCVVVVGSSVGFFLFKRRGKKEAETLKTTELPVLSGVESDEDKAVRLIKSSGGSLYQAAITRHCKFSKAKTSQLLKVLEDKGMVKRYKKGRDKIVVLVEQDEK
jgi:uncharacterized membrane protein